MKDNQIIIIHSLNGKPYFEAVEYLAKKKEWNVKYYESSIIKLFIRDILKKQFSKNTIKRSLKNLIFRIQVPFIKNKTIIYCTAPFDFRMLWYSLLMKKNNFIYHTSHPYWNDDKKAVFKYYFLKPFWKNFLKKCPKIVAVTQQSTNTLRNNYDVNQIYQIYHTVDVKKFFSKNKDFNFNVIKILFVGKIIKEKGIDTLIDLINKLPEDKFSFGIVGDGSYRYKIEPYLQKKNVKFYGWISDKTKLAEIYKNYHIFLNPSIRNSKWEELFGIVNIEAMASGLVVIASNHIGPSEIIENGVNGFLVEEKKVDEIIDIINNLYVNRNLLKQMSQNAILYSKKFDISQIAKQWEIVLNEK